MENQFNCPNCGNPLMVVKRLAQRKRQPRRRVVGRRYETGIATGDMPPWLVDDDAAITEPTPTRYRETPIRKPDVESDVTVPMLRAISISVMVAALWWFCAVWYLSKQSPYSRVLGGGDVFAIGILIIIVGTLVQFINFDRMTHAIEEIFNPEPSEPHSPPQLPPPQSHDLNITQTDTDGSTTIKRISLPDGLGWDAWEDFCHAVIYEGRTFGRGNLAEGADAIMTRKQWMLLMPWLDQQKYTAEDSRGVRHLTHIGEMVLRGYADQRTRYTPQ